MSITLQELVIDCSISYQRIESFELESAINEHAKLTATLFISDEYKGKAISLLKDTKVVARNRQSGEIYFRGIISAQKTRIIGGDIYLELTAFSNSILADIKDESRSFQNEAELYDDVINQICFSMGANYSAIVDTKVTIGTWLLQYGQTDFKFLKEFARRLKTFIVVDETAPLFQFEMGLRQRQMIPTLQIDYSLKREQTEQGKMTFACHFQSTTYYPLGSRLRVASIEYIVTQRSMKLINAEIVFSYRSVFIGMLENLQPAPLQYTGRSLTGTVISVKEDKIKVHFDIDEEQTQNQARWIPYVPQENSIAYYMPEIGSRVQVYLPSEDLSEVIAINTIRTTPRAADESKWLATPETKLLSNVENKQISLQPDALNIATKESEIYINLHDQQGIQIQSNSDIEIQASGNVHFTNAKTLDISARKSIILQACDESSLYIETDVQLRSDHVQVKGIDGAPIQGLNLKKAEPPTRGSKTQDASKVRDSAMSLVPSLADSTQDTGLDSAALATIPRQTNAVSGSGFKPNQAISRMSGMGNLARETEESPVKGAATFNEVKNLSTPIIDPQRAMDAKRSRLARSSNQVQLNQITNAVRLFERHQLSRFSQGYQLSKGSLGSRYTIKNKS